MSAGKAQSEVVTTLGCLIKIIASMLNREPVAGHFYDLLKMGPHF
jgi:hypothetical protein